MKATQWNGCIALSIAVATVTAPSVVAQAPPQTIFKCVDGDATAYQSMPCGRGQAEVHVMTVARAETPDKTAAAIPTAAAPLPTAQSPGRMWPPRRTLMLGMSDDEVLNLSGWGVPQHITRTKTPRGWREDWSYATPSGERRLTFVNATLVDAVLDAQAVQQIASDRRAAYPPT